MGVGDGSPLLPPHQGDSPDLAPSPLPPCWSPHSSLVWGARPGGARGAHCCFCPSLLSLPAIKFPRIVGVSKYPCPGLGGPVLCSCPTPALTLASEPGPLPAEALQSGSLAWGSLASLPQGAKSSKQPGVVGGETGKQVFPTQARTGASRLPSAPTVCLDLSSMNSRGR